MHWHPADAQTRCRPLDYKFMCKACGTGWPEAANQCWVCPGKEFAPFQAPYEADGVTYNLLIVEGKPTWMGEAWVPLAPVVPATWWTARSWGELLRKRTRQRRSPWLTWSRETGGGVEGPEGAPGTDLGGVLGQAAAQGVGHG